MSRDWGWVKVGLRNRFFWAGAHINKFLFRWFRFLGSFLLPKPKLAISGSTYRAKYFYFIFSHQFLQLILTSVWVYLWVLGPKLTTLELVTFINYFWVIWNLFWGLLIQLKDFYFLMTFNSAFKCWLKIFVNFGLLRFTRAIFCC